MSFTEIDLFGVYVAPISVMIVAAWLLMIPIRWAAVHAGVLRSVWHPGALRVRPVHDRIVVDYAARLALE